jgi:hypothetical protein
VTSGNSSLAISFERRPRSGIASSSISNVLTIRYLGIATLYAGIA